MSNAFVFASYLLEQGYLEVTQHDELIELLDKRQNTPLQIALQKEWLNESQAIQATSKHLHLPPAQSKPVFSTELFIPEIFHDLLKTKSCIPLQINTDSIIVGLSDPDFIDTIYTKLTPHFSHIHIHIVSYSNYLTVRTYWHIQCNYQEPFHIPNLVQTLFEDAILKKTSDIHIEPQKDHTRIRFRIDGLLRSILKVPKAVTQQLVSHIKMLSHLDITEKRRPQDGRYFLSQIASPPVECRIHTCATQHGEKIVIRLLPTKQIHFSFIELGMLPNDIGAFKTAMQKKHGLILITGPTGSGKTSTLYTALKQLNTEEYNILTLEDPVEIQIPGINQMPIKPNIGFDFAAGLRSALRQDPDILMVGEIRDLETAQLAVRAALTGHLVFSTLHTHNSLEAIARLLNIGISTHDLAGTLSLIVSQRLLRRLCHHCKASENSHCSFCFSGYKGRIGIFECLTISQILRNLIAQNASQDQLQKAALNDGWQPLLEKCELLLQAGITSSQEIGRVIQ